MPTRCTGWRPMTCTWWHLGSAAGRVSLGRDRGPVRRTVAVRGWSSCFRREAGSYGKDTAASLGCISSTRWRLRLLHARRRRSRTPTVTGLAARDAGAHRGAVPGNRRGRGRSRLIGARKFDCEAWVPTQQTYRELTSTSNCTTFQARRLATRYRDATGSRTLRPPSTERWAPRGGWCRSWKTTSSQTAACGCRALVRSSD